MFFRKLCVAAALIVSGTGAVSASEIITDNYIGKGDSNDVIGNGNYNIYDMIISRTAAGIMTVRINTPFVDINNGGNGGHYTFGDLLMSVKSGSDSAAWEPYGSSPYSNDDFQNTDTTWEYAYDLNGARGQTGNFLNNSSARLVSIDSPTDANSYDYGSVRMDGGTANDHIWRTDDNYTTNLNSGGTHSVQSNTNANFLEFVFDVSGTDLATANQIAFHWTMSCANDVIEGMANFTTDTPEPAMLGLLGLGLFGMGYARRRKVAA